MRPFECAREQDVLDAIATRRWPERCDAELRDHVAACSICADVVDVVGPLTESHDAIWPEIQVPSSGTVWWRAQVRARQEATRRASRPITIVQVAASVAALVVLVTVAYAVRPWIPAFSLSLPAIPFPELNLQLPEVPSIYDLSLWSWVGIGVCLFWAVIGPLAIYLATLEDKPQIHQPLDER